MANVAYDTFLGTSASGAQAYEVMVWLGDFGGCSPLSNDGYPATPYAYTTIGGVEFGLDIGANGNTVVYSFVATSKAATTFRYVEKYASKIFADTISISGDFLLFYKYLEANYSLSPSLYLQTFQAGTEVFTGSNAKLTTTSYSIAMN